MASPSINWDDFENQALLIQELLSDPKEIDDCHLTSEVGAPTDSHQPKKLRDSPVLITTVATPPTLVMLSPDTQQHSIDKHKALALTPVKRKSDNSSLQHLENEVKTPLKDCTNISQKDLKILTDYMVTPENIKGVVKSQNTSCPSSAEFKKFLEDIMGASPAMNVFENEEETAVNQCQLQVGSKTQESLPVVKVHTRRGTYDLDEPSCDLSTLSECESTFVPAQLIKPAPDLLVDLSSDTPRKTCFVAGGTSGENNIVLPNKLHSEKSVEDKSDQTQYGQLDNTPLQNGNTEMQKGNAELRSGNGERHNDFTKAQKNNNEDETDNEFPKEITVVQKVNQEVQSVQAYKDSIEYQNTHVHIDKSSEAQRDITEAQKDSTEVQKDNTESHKVINEELKEKTETQKVLNKVSDMDPNALKPSSKLICRNSNLRRPHSRFSSATGDVCVKSQAPIVKAADIDYKSSLPRKPAGDIAENSVASEIKAEEHEEVVLEKSSVVDKKRENNFSDVCKKTGESACRVQSDFKHATSSVSSSDGSSAERQDMPDAAPENESSAEKQDIPDALSENDSFAERQKIPDSLTKIESSAGKQAILDFLYENDSSAEKPDIPDALSEKDISAEKQNIPDAPLQSPSKTAASVLDHPGKTTEKTDICPSTVVLKKAPVSKLPLMRPGQMQSKLRRPSSGIASLQAQRTATTSVPVEGVKRNSAALPLKPAVKQRTEGSDLGQKKTQETSRLLPKLHLRPPSKPSERSLLALKAPSSQLKLEAKVGEQEAVKSLRPQNIQPPCNLEATQPAAAKLTFRPSGMKDNPATFIGKGGVKASLQFDGSRTVTKRTSPMKALFPLDGSRTITKDVHSDMLRTVKKEAQPAGSRTVTKTSDGLLSKTPNNRQSTPGTTDKFIAPRRLSNVFNRSSTLSYSSKNSVNSSYKKPALDSSNLESMVTIDESGAFKVESGKITKGSTGK